MAGVRFGLDLPPRRPESPEFDASPVSAPLLTGEQRRHHELLAALTQLGQAITDLQPPEPVPVVQAAQAADPMLLASAVRDALSPLVEAQNVLTAEALSGVLDRLKVLSRQVVAFASGGSGSGSASGHVIVDSGTINLGTAVTLDSTAINTIGEALTNTELRASPVPVSGTVTVTDNRTLTERMLAKAPQVNYSLYLDTADSTYIYLAEGPTADTAASTTAQGIRVVKDASGNPLGRVQIATGFAWNSRSSATWA